MKRSFSIISIILLLCIALCSFVACDGSGDEPENEFVDYVDGLKLDMNSNTAKKEVTVRYYIDGDTTHFFPKGSTNISEVMKARYLAVDTPESTGAIEEWGKAASRFTEEKLSSAVSIIVESDDSNWNQDGNGRDLLWIWYKPSEDADYRNLNVELIQNGLGHSTSANEGRYGETAWAAYEQAEANSLYVHSKNKDPDYPYDAAIPVTIKELRINIDKYLGKNVQVVGISNFNADNTSYLEEYDPETDMYYAIQVFYSYNSNRIDLFKQGNEVRVVGTVMDFHGTYQISNITYNPLRPNDPANSAKLSTGNEVGYRETTAERFGGVEMTHPEDSTRELSFGELAVSSSISMTNLEITRVTTTTNPDSNDLGAMTIYCKQGESYVQIRTEVLYDSEGTLITSAYFPIGSTISIKGIIDYYDYDTTDEDDGVYQIRVYNLNDIVKGEN